MASTKATKMQKITAAGLLATLGIAGWAARQDKPGTEAGREKPVPPQTGSVETGQVRSADVVLPPLPPPRLNLRGSIAGLSPVTLSRADVRINVAGPLARTSLTLTFRNPNNRVLEGGLEFPLPENATLSGYALDVNGELVEAVPVEKHEARVIFEKEERKGIDPGLVEQTAGNNFRTRIYPIPAKGTRTVRVEYVSDLLTRGSDLAHVVPLNWKQTIAEARVQIEVAPGTDVGQPIFTWGDRQDVLPQPVRNASGGYAVEKTFANIPFTGDMVLRLPGGLTRQLVAVEPFTRNSASEAETYFVVSDLAPTAPPVPGVSALSARRVGIAWDASLSRKGADLARERRLLASYLRTLGNTTVDLMVLRDKAEPIRSFTITNGQSGELMAFLEALPCDGGTNLGALHLDRDAESADGQNAPYACWLLFTDGLGNLGESSPPFAGAPVFAIGSDARADHNLLRYVAQKSGGAYLNLSRVSDVDALRQIGVAPFSLISVTTDSGQVADVYPNGTQPAQGRTLVSGRLLSDEATVTLNYGIGGQITERRTVTLRRNEAQSANGLVARAWAGQKAAALSVFAEKNHDDLSALGRDFGLVTPGTSLLVLESLQQHLEYNIAPAKSRTALYAAWSEQQSAKRTAETRENGDKLQHVLSLWNDRVRWWEQEFKYPANFRYKKEQEGRVLAAGGGGVPGAVAEAQGSARGEVARAYAPRPAPPASAAPATPALYDSAGGRGAGGYPGGRMRQASLGVAAEAKKAKDDSGGESEQAQSSITIKPWSPDVPYLKALKAEKPEGIYAAYLKEREAWADAPAFYLDCAEVLLSRGRTEEGIRVLSNIAELKLEDAGLLRILAHRLAQLGRRDQAIGLFEKVLTMRPEEPQSWRDLALVLADRADVEAQAARKLTPNAQADRARVAINDYNRSLTLLHKVVMNRWDRFDEIETIALMEANRVMARAKELLPEGQKERLTVPFDARLVKNLPCDMRITLTWDTDLTDMDLWVTEPSGETCIYSHNRTVIGGHLSRDFTQGYGPEEYILRRAMTGAYKVQSNYYGTRQQSLTGGTTVQATVITDWGRPTEKKQYLTLRLRDTRDTVDIGSVAWDGAKK